MNTELLLKDPTNAANLSSNFIHQNLDVKKSKEKTKMLSKYNKQNFYHIKNIKQ